MFVVERVLTQEMRALPNTERAIGGQGSGSRPSELLATLKDSQHP